MTNSKSTKRALASGVLALVLCVSMLVGTTFAWFTDTASTNVNTIQAGTLDVALEMKEGNTWVSAEGKTLNFVAADGRSNILWEPGCTYTLPELRIVNNGNLALKYKVVITGIQGDAKLNEVIDWTVGEAAQGAERSLAAGGYEEFTISGKMRTSAGNAYQGLSINGVSITVLATQNTVEKDSNGDQYDADAKYSTANVQTTKMFISGGNQTVNETLSINSDETGGNSDVIRVTGGDHVITGGTYTAYGTTKSNSCLRVDGGTVTIKGGTFTVNSSSNAIYGAGGNIVIEGGTFKSAAAYSGTWFTLNCQDYSGSVITVKGGKFYQFDPSNCQVAPAGQTEVVVAEGYRVEQVGDWYHVVPENASIAASGADISNTAANGTVVLAGDVTTGNTASYGSNTVGVKLAPGATLDGNGSTLSKGDGSGFAILTSGATIKNVTLNDSGRAIFIDKATEDTVLDNVVIDGTGYAINTGDRPEGTITAKLIVTNSTVNGWTSFANIASARFTNCSFGSSNYYSQEVFQHYLRPYVTATFTDCDFDEGFYIDITKLGEGCTITLSNCTCNGVKLTKDNFADYIKLIKGVVNNADVYAENGDTVATVIWG